MVMCQHVLGVNMVSSSRLRWAGHVAVVEESKVFFPHGETAPSERVIVPTQRPLTNSARQSQGDIYALDPVRTHDSSKRAAADPGLRSAESTNTYLLTYLLTCLLHGAESFLRS